MAVVAFDQQVVALLRSIGDGLDLGSSNVKLERPGQSHTKSFVEYAAIDPGNGRFKDVRAGRAVQGQARAQTVRIQHHRQFVLCARQREAQTVFTRAHGAQRHFIKHLQQLRGV